MIARARNNLQFCVDMRKWNNMTIIGLIDRVAIHYNMFCALIKKLDWQPRYKKIWNYQWPKSVESDKKRLEMSFFRHFLTVSKTLVDNCFRQQITSSFELLVFNGGQKPAGNVKKIWITNDAEKLHFQRPKAVGNVKKLIFLIQYLT